jgi:hypothetical protein
MKNEEKTSRNEEIRRIRLSGDFSITEIANKFSVSKQRIHQITGTMGFLYQNKRTATIKSIIEGNKELSNGDIASMLGTDRQYVSALRTYLSIRGHHKVDGGAAEVGEKAEGRVSAVLREMGIENTLMGYRSPFDILLNKTGIRIDVKYTSRILDIAGSINKPYNWRTHVNRKSSKSCDYFILCSPDFSFFVIIPFDKTPELVRFCYPFPSMGRETKYKKYINAFSLLQG